MVKGPIVCCILYVLKPTEALLDSICAPQGPPHSPTAQVVYLKWQGKKKSTKKNFSKKKIKHLTR